MAGMPGKLAFSRRLQPKPDSQQASRNDLEVYSSHGAPAQGIYYSEWTEANCENRLTAWGKSPSVLIQSSGYVGISVLVPTGTFRRNSQAIPLRTSSVLVRSSLSKSDPEH